MLYWFSRPLRFLLFALASKDSPKQMAAGFALGMMLGLIPKGNLIATVLTMLLMATRANLSAGVVAAFLFSWVGSFTDGLSFQLGSWLLTRPQFQDAYVRLYNLPLAPWTCFNYPSVLGSFYLGLGLAYPIYRLMKPLFAWLQPRANKRLEEWGWVNKVAAKELAWSWRMG